MARERNVRNDRRARNAGLKQLPWRAVTNPYKPIEVLSEDQIEAIHNASLRILEDIGMDFMHVEAQGHPGQGGREDHARHRPGAVRPRPDPGEDQDGAAGVHAACAQPGAQPHHRRQPHQLLHRGERAQRQRPRRRPPAGQLRRLPELPAPRAGASTSCTWRAAIRSSRSTCRRRPAISTAWRRLVTLTDKVFHAYSLGRSASSTRIEIVRIARGITKRAAARRSPRSSPSSTPTRR